ncbi:MAG: sulfotransferase family protein [Actinomycetota bacterium]|nr:sulfotransferase family protein [Actinomycetota bacterium]
MAVTSAAASLSGWTPIRVDWDRTDPTVDWCHTDGIPFAEPFFDQTVEACFRNPCRLLFRQRTGIDEVGRFAADHPGLPPAAFIFHMSRCGSTLVAQMLAAARAHLVVSEAGPVDGVLRAARPAGARVAEEERATWLRWMVAALGQPRSVDQRRLYVKFDAWSVADLPVVRRAFPGVPWLFLYRDPVEVLVSHSGRPGAHVVPGTLAPETIGMTPADVDACPPLEYRARVLARICEAALDHADDPEATFVEYRQLPGFVLSGLLRGVPLGTADTDRMLAAAGRDAKNPVLPFEADGRRKRAEATAPLRAAADRWLAPLYDRLERAGARQQRRDRRTG